MLRLNKIVSNKSPKDTVVEYYTNNKTIPPYIATKNEGYELPINGGWGYNKEDAVMINNLEYSPFNEDMLKRIFAYNRLDIELDEYEKVYKKIAGFDLELETEQLIKNDTKIYAKSIFDCSIIFRDELHDYEDGFYIENEGFRLVSLDMKIDEKLRKKIIKFQREYWFDISDIYKEKKVDHVVIKLMKKFFRS